MSKYYCYVDETSHNDSGLCGAGLLLTTQDGYHEVIQSALEKLEQDPDCDEKDRKIIEKGYFHASEGTPRALRYFCSAVKSSVKGTLVCVLFDRKVSGVLRKKGFTESKVQNIARDIAAYLVLREGKHAEIIIERRKGLGELGSKWLEMLRRSQDQDHWGRRQNWMPITYPPMTCETSDKNEPGLQITDFLLWATVRAIHKEGNWKENQPNWANEVGLALAHIPHAKGGNSGLSKEGVYLATLGKVSPEVPPTEYGSEIAAILDRLPEESEVQAWAKYYCIEGFVSACAKEPPSSVAHLKTQLDQVTTLLRDPQLCCTPKAMFQLATVFLRLFDTLPLHHPDHRLSPDELRVLFAARETAAIAVRKDQVAGSRVLADMAKRRNAALANDPTSLAFHRIFNEM